MKLRASFVAGLVGFFALTCCAITIEDLVGTYVGKWTQNELPNGGVNRYEAVAVFEPDSRVSTYVYVEFPPDIFSGSGIIDIQDDGSFMIGEGDALGQMTLHGKHLHVLVRWSHGATVEFKGHLSRQLPDWFPVPAPE